MNDLSAVRGCNGTEVAPATRETRHRDDEPDPTDLTMTDFSDDSALVQRDGSGRVTLDEVTYRVAEPDVALARLRVSEIIRTHAAGVGEPRTIHLQDPDGTWVVRVDPGGDLHAEPAEPPEPPSRGDIPSSSEGEEGLAPESDDVSPGRAVLTGRSALPMRSIAVVTGAAVLVATGVGAAWWNLSGEGEPAKPTTVRAPLDPASGWSKTAAWASPALAGRDSPVLVVDKTVITTVTSDSGPVLVALRATDGKVLWESPIEGHLTGPPQLTRYKGKPAVAAATDHTLMIWPLDSTSHEEGTFPRTWTFTEAGVELVPGSPAPLLANEKTLTALVLDGDRLENRTLPQAGAHPIAAASDGRAVAVTDDGHWWSLEHGDAQAPEAKLLSPPGWGSLVRDVLGMAGDTLVVSWSRGKWNSTLVGYDVADGMTRKWKVKVSGKVSPEDFDVAPDGSWMIAGDTAISSSSGENQSLPESWDTMRITAAGAWSTKARAPKLESASSLPDPVRDPATIPTDVTPRRGLLVATTSDGQRKIFALPPS